MNASKYKRMSPLLSTGQRTWASTRGGRTRSMPRCVRACVRALIHFFCFQVN